MYLNLVLKGRVPSKKNSKQRTWKMLISSKSYQEREKKQLKELKKQVDPLGIAEGVKVKYIFYMPDNRVADLSNKVESINDLFVKYGLIKDDNRKILNELYIVCSWVDKENPRVEIEIYNQKQLLIDL